MDSLRRVLKGETFQAAGTIDITRSLPHGHVAAVLGTIRKLGIAPMIDGAPSRQRDLVVAMIATRILEPRSKLATARGLDPETATSSFVDTLELGSATADDSYEA